ncbi:hypothetical protein HPP92_013312 [Vanilla planifolia]|uniref:RING-type domain-containing protein n=1 Tax=Vanilla planifolia TaxID=51239 RepID=A0A835R264_VANPL|nr:hypothetical protein HPP92_013312 [Vanilla planifolia]
MRPTPFLAPSPEAQTQACTTTEPDGLTLSLNTFEAIVIKFAAAMVCSAMAVLILAALAKLAVGLVKMVRAWGQPLQVAEEEQKEEQKEGRENTMAAGSVCAICLEEFGRQDAVRQLPECRHGYHAKCIDRWIVERGTCPTCRRWGRGTARLLSSGSGGKR